MHIEKQKLAEAHLVLISVLLSPHALPVTHPWVAYTPSSLPFSSLLSQAMGSSELTGGVGGMGLQLSLVQALLIARILATFGQAPLENGTSSPVGSPSFRRNYRQFPSIK